MRCLVPDRWRSLTPPVHARPCRAIAWQDTQCSVMQRGTWPFQRPVPVTACCCAGLCCAGRHPEGHHHHLVSALVGCATDAGATPGRALPLYRTQGCGLCTMTLNFNHLLLPLNPQVLRTGLADSGTVREHGAAFVPAPPSAMCHSRMQPVHLDTRSCAPAHPLTSRAPMFVQVQGESWRVNAGVSKLVKVT